MQSALKFVMKCLILITSFCPLRPPKDRVFLIKCLNNYWTSWHNLCTHSFLCSESYWPDQEPWKIILCLFYPNDIEPNESNSDNNKSQLGLWLWPFYSCSFCNDSLWENTYISGSVCITWATQRLQTWFGQYAKLLLFHSLQMILLCTVLFPKWCHWKLWKLISARKVCEGEKIILNVSHFFTRINDCINNQTSDFVCATL